MSNSPSVPAPQELERPPGAELLLPPPEKRSHKNNKHVARRSQTHINRKPRVALSPSIDYALSCMAFNGMRRDQAAQAAGISDEYLRQAMGELDVRKALTSKIEVLRAGHVPEAWLKVASLMRSADSQRVQLDAAKTLIGETNQPAVNVTVNTQTNIQPGYLVDVSQYYKASSAVLEQAGSVRRMEDE